MDAVPALMPVIIPAEPAMATDVLLLLQAPPVAVLLNVVVLPAHRIVVPVMAGGSALTLKVTNTKQPPAV
jgi:hypothetical protein